MRTPTPRSEAGFSALELTGIMTIVLIVGSLLFWWGTSVATRARELVCRSNLKQIATALLLYAHDHGDRLPPNADAIPYLANTYVKNQQLFACPVDHSPATIRFVPPPDPRPPFHQGKWPPSPPSPTTMQTSYFIVPGVATDDPPASIIAGETKPRHRGRWHAACLDGRIIALPAAELPKYLPPGGERR